jgi:hypothetical protein
MYEEIALLFNAQRVTYPAAMGCAARRQSEEVLSQIRTGESERVKYHASDCNYSYHTVDNCFTLFAAALCADAQIKTPARRLA